MHKPKLNIRLFFLARAYYIPKRKGDRVIWLNNHKAKIATHGATIGLTPAEILARQNSCDAINNEINRSAQMKQQLELQYDAERALTKTELEKIQAGVARDKTDAGFTTAIGQDLGEIGNEVSFDFINAVPVLILKKTSEGWRISFELKDFFTSCYIERLRPAGTWTYLGDDTSSPYMDADPQVNGTKYRGIYKIGDNKMDNFSDEVTVEV